MISPAKRSPFTSLDPIFFGSISLTLTPPEGDIKILQGYSDGRQRLRVGKYRVIFRFISDDQIEIVYIIDIGARGDIYK